MALPKTIYVREQKESDGTTFLLAELTPEEAIEDDGPTVVGTYVLQEAKTLQKLAQEVPEKTGLRQRLKIG